jgi:hypothetical protein
MACSTVIAPQAIISGGGSVKSLGGRAGTGSLGPHFFTQKSQNYFFVYPITSAKFVGLGGGQDENLAARRDR